MIVANLSNGLTQHFDVSDPSQLEELRRLANVGSLSGLSILFQGSTNSLPCPKKFRTNIIYGVDVLYDRKAPGVVVGESIYVQAGTVRSTISLTYETRHVRHDLENTGRMRYNPDNRTDKRTDNRTRKERSKHWQT